MITRVPVSISVGTRGTRELLMSLLVEALLLTLKAAPKLIERGLCEYNQSCATT